MKNSRQLSFDLPGLKERTRHGGDLNKGQRKTWRPITTNQAIHVVFRLSEHMQKRYSLLSYQKQIRGIIEAMGKDFRVKTYRFANVGNHIHLVIKGQTRDGIKNFLRSVSALIARKITGAKKGNPLDPTARKSDPYRRKFWAGLVFTRVLTWGRDFQNAWRYVVQNELETNGLIPFQARNPRKRKFQGAPPNPQTLLAWAYGYL